MVLLPAGVCWMAFYQVTSSTEHESDDHRPVIVAAMKGNDPGIRLQAMFERRPSRRTSCEASQVKMLLGRAEKFGAEGQDIRLLFRIHYELHYLDCQLARRRKSYL